MELFLPSIMIILLSAFFIFMILPRMGSTILLVTSILALFLVGYNHYSMFYDEYRLSTWQQGISAYAPWLVVLLSFIFLAASMQHIFAGPANYSSSSAEPSIVEQISESVSDSIKNMPSAETATNVVTAAVNNAINSAKNLVSPEPNKSGNNKSGNNKPNNNRSKKNESPYIPGLQYKSSEV
jgi:hypothetical protein